MPVPDDEFYLEPSPNFLQQGDILTGVPLLLLPPSTEMVLLREPRTQRFLPDPTRGLMEAVREQVVGDAFNHGAEYVVVSAVRSLAVLITQTCDLSKRDTWLVAPANRVAGSGYDAGNLKAGKYSTLFYLPEHEHFPAAYLDLTDIRAISNFAIGFGNRIASMTREAQYDLADRMVRSFGRKWGYAPHDVVPPLQKHEVANYRCYSCNEYAIPATEIQLVPGTNFPICASCAKIGKTAQWYPLRKHRRS